MAGNANTTISHPGPDWQMLWGNGGFDNFQLDIVGFLAVLGEGSVTANSQVSALSPLFYLPRILPAPQALLPVQRPKKLPSREASVTAVQSGNTKDHVYHVAHVLLGDELKKHEVRCVEVTKKSMPLKRAGNVNPVVSSLQKAFTLFRSQSGTPSTPDRPVTANTTGPLSWVTLLGCFLSISLFITSIVCGDGMSLIATLLLSFLSTLTGVANKWELKLPTKPEGVAGAANKRQRDVPKQPEAVAVPSQYEPRRASRPQGTATPYELQPLSKPAGASPPGDTVIRYPNGSFLIVKCDDAIARELFFAPEEIEYRLSDPTKYRIISLVGTVILMLGIIALANAKLQLQFAWAGAYIITNAAHWIAAALPEKMHWDLGCYDLKEQGIEGGPHSKTFTEALWKTIVVTKDTRWVKNGKAAPQTHVWDEWLVYAKDSAQHAQCVDGEEILDPIFPDGNPTKKGLVWKLPEGWDPRDEWMKISQPAQQAAEQGALPADEAA